jgi:malate synthase
MSTVDGVETSRSQVWRWLHDGVTLDDGRQSPPCWCSR